MDLPVKMDFKLNHFHLLALFLPFIPGLVAMAGLTLGDSSLSHRFAALEVGYATKLAITIGFAYIFGLASMVVVDAVSALVAGKLAPVPSVAIPDNIYWRRVAAQYVGPNLSPEHGTWSTEDFDRLVNYIGSLAGQPDELKETMETYKKALEQYDELVKKSALGDAHIDPATALGAHRVAADNPAQAQLTERRTRLEAVRTTLRSMGSKTEWNSLHHALHFIPTTVQEPYYAFGQIAEALLAAGVVALCMMARYPDLFDLGGLLFILALLTATTWVTWLLRKMRSSFTTSGAYQIGVMLHEMRRSSHNEGQRADPRDG